MDDFQIVAVETRLGKLIDARLMGDTFTTQAGARVFLRKWYGVKRFKQHPAGFKGRKRMGLSRLTFTVVDNAFIREANSYAD